MSMAPPQGSPYVQQQAQQPPPLVVSSYSYHAQPMKPTAVLAGKPTLIQWDRLRFLIMDAPRDANLVQYIREARAHNVTDMVRVCEPSYCAKEVEAAGIRVHEMSYEDGASPPPDVIDRWLALVEEVFYKPAASNPGGQALLMRRSSSSASASASASRDSASSYGHAPAAADPNANPAHSNNSPQHHSQQNGSSQSTIAVHCVAGLGRAPVLVALALIEHGYGDPSAVVEFIRSQRRGAINMRQLNYLEQYQKRTGSQCACAIM